ncbi:MAG: type ISP restriction/modification enzyme, partial [Promethearchaeota archaeon]
MTVTKHAKKLAILSKTSRTALHKHLPQLNTYFESTISHWNVTSQNPLDLFIQIFIYLGYKLYLTYYRNEKYELITEAKRFTKHFSRNLFIDEPIPSELIDFLIHPVITEIQKWNPPDRKEINDFFVFYGIFLRHYKPDFAKEAGIVHTPKILVNFVINGIHTLAKSTFGIKNGLKNEHFPFKIIDPAAGTMNFIVGLLQFLDKPKGELNTIYDNILTMELKELPYILGMNEILSLFNPHSKNTHYILRNTLSKESFTIMDNFLDINRDSSISILLGNPPYYINTQNNLPWIQTEIKEYKKSLNEKNLKILSDDYVKFFRISQKLFQEKRRTGIIAYITNNNYLDGPVFKSMRKSLINTFNEIYIVNLHGNLRKNETGNPFNIKVGVSIIFLVRSDPDYDPDPDNTLSYLEYGGKVKIHYWDIDSPDLSSKHKILSKGFNIELFNEVELTPDYFFIPREYDVERRFQKFVPINELFLRDPKSGIMTGRDSLVSNPDKAILDENMSLFFHRQFEDLRKLNVTVNQTKTWDPAKALKRSSENRATSSIIRYFYRGLIQDFLVYDKFLVDGCRLGYLDTISSTNPAICVTRSIRADHYSHALVVDAPPEKCLLGIKDSSYVFTLYQPQDLEKFNLNLDNIEFDLEPKLLFYYIYAILYSPTYRSRYVEQLKRHFPGIPISKNKKKITGEMVKLGQQLVEIHLGQARVSWTDFNVNNPTYRSIRDFNFDKTSNILYFSNDTDALSIADISQEMWDFEIRTIKQLFYWLKSRKFVNKAENQKKRHIG